MTRLRFRWTSIVLPLGLVVSCAGDGAGCQNPGEGCDFEEDCAEGSFCCDTLGSCLRDEDVDQCPSDPPPAVGGQGGQGGTGGNPSTGGAGGMQTGGAPPEPILEGTFTTPVQAVEAAAIILADSFEIASRGPTGLFEDDLYVAFAGENGQAVHILSDGSVAFDFTEMGAPSYAVIGANNSLVSIGPDGYADRRYSAGMDAFGFAQLGLLGNNITGIAPIRAATSVNGLLLANNTANRVHRLDPLTDAFGGFTSGGLVVDEVQFATVGLSGNNVVHAYSPPGEGPIIGVGDSPAAGQPGRLWWYDPASSTSLVNVGPLGEGPRRIACLEPEGTPCAVSSYFAGELALLDWADRDQPPSIGTTTVAVAGPVGIDMALVDGQPTVVSTGFDDDSIHITTIGAGLVPTDQAFTLPDCSNPGHVIFLPNASHVLVTCNGSDSYQVHPLPLSL